MSQFGSLQNTLAARTIGAPEPEVGMGATVLLWSDRNAVTIVEVIRFKTGARAGQVKAVKVQRDKATRTDPFGMSDAQSYAYEPNPDGVIREFKATKDGRFKNGSGASLLIGARDEYYDYTF